MYFWVIILFWLSVVEEQKSETDECQDFAVDTVDSSYFHTLYAEKSGERTCVCACVFSFSFLVVIRR